MTSNVITNSSKSSPTNSKKDNKTTKTKKQNQKQTTKWKKHKKNQSKFLSQVMIKKSKRLFESFLILLLHFCMIFSLNLRKKILIFTKNFNQVLMQVSLFFFFLPLSHFLLNHPLHHPLHHLSPNFSLSHNSFIYKHKTQKTLFSRRF